MGKPTVKSRDSRHNSASVAGREHEIDGLRYLQAIMRREMKRPPSLQLLEVELIDVQPGQVSWAFIPDASMAWRTGALLPGIMSALLDTAASTALLSTLPASKSMVWLAMNVSYLKSAELQPNPLTAIGTVVERRGLLGIAEAKVTTESGAILATATSTLMITADRTTHSKILYDRAFLADEA